MGMTESGSIQTKKLQLRLETSESDFICRGESQVRRVRRKPRYFDLSLHHLPDTSSAIQQQAYKVDGVYLLMPLLPTMQDLYISTRPARSRTSTVTTARSTNVPSLTEASDSCSSSVASTPTQTSSYRYIITSSLPLVPAQEKPHPPRVPTPIPDSVHITYSSRPDSSSRSTSYSIPETSSIFTAVPSESISDSHGPPPCSQRSKASNSFSPETVTKGLRCMTISPQSPSSPGLRHDTRKPSYSQSPVSPIQLSPTKPRHLPATSLPAITTPFDAPTPFNTPAAQLSPTSSPGEIPILAAPVPSRRQSQPIQIPSVKPRSFSNQRNRSTSSTQRNVDPSDETHYYTACPHTSPPCTRPLNVQPSVQPATILQYPPDDVETRESSLTTSRTSNNQASIPQSVNPYIRGPSTHLRSRSRSRSRDRSSASYSQRSQSASSKRAPPTSYRPPISSDERSVNTASAVVSTIEGSCVQCDTANRRRQETRTLTNYALQIEDLESRYNMFLRDSQSAHPMDLEANEITLASLKGRMEKLLKKRDGEVKEIWKGYAQRWGLGAIGIMREAKTEGSDGRKVSAASQDSGMGMVEGIDPTGRMKLDWIRP